MANFYSGPGEPIVQITASDTLYVELFLADAADPTAGKTGVTYDAAGMTVKVSKPGGGFDDFPSFGTDNWAEVGYGWYRLAFRGGTAGELALLDTVGLLKVYVKATATKAANVGRKLIAARQAETADLAYLDAAVSSRAAPGAEMDLVDAPNATAVTAIQDGLAVPGDQMDLVDAPNATAVTAIQDGLAVPGDEMDLVDAPNATAVTAIQDGLSTLGADDVEGAVWDALLANHADPNTTGEALAMAGAAGDPWAIPVPGTYDPGTAGDVLGNRLNDTITSREADGAAAAAVAGLNDPSASDVAAAVWSYSPRTVTGISPEIGDSLVTVTLEDDGGNPVPGIRAGVYDAADNLLVVAATGGTGQFTCYLPDGEYTVVYGPQGANYAFANPYALTVDGDTAETHECEALSVPISSAPETCACYLDVRAADGGGLVGENEAWLEILRIEAPLWPVALDDQTAALGRNGQTYYSDANGRITVELVRGAQVRLRVGTGTPAVPREETRLSLTVPDAASYRINTEEE